MIFPSRTTTDGFLHSARARGTVTLRGFCIFIFFSNNFFFLHGYFQTELVSRTVMVGRLLVRRGDHIGGAAEGDDLCLIGFFVQRLHPPPHGPGLHDIMHVATAGFFPTSDRRRRRRRREHSSRSSTQCHTSRPDRRRGNDVMFSGALVCTIYIVLQLGNIHVCRES